MDRVEKPAPAGGQFLTLVQRARGGDGEALGALLESCRQYLNVVANRELGPALQPKLDGSDLVQKTFLDAQRDFQRFDGNQPGAFLGWVERILLNNVADCARQYRGTDKRRLEREVPLDPGSTPLDLAGDDSTPSQHAIAREEREKLDRAIARLPEDYRLVILLRNQEKRPFEEIGRLLGRSADAAKKLWGRALVQLGKELHAPA